MGCLNSKLEEIESPATLTSHESVLVEKSDIGKENRDDDLRNDDESNSVETVSLKFQHFSLAEILDSTSSFSEASLISEEESRSSNSVYRGTIKGCQVAIKKLPAEEWPDADEFKAEAERMGALSLPGVTPLLGYCISEGFRILVAQLVHNGTLPNYLFHYTGRPMTLEQRMNVAKKVALTLVELSEHGFPVYHDLTAYRILMGKDLEPQLSCFGLIKAEKEIYSSNLQILPPEYLIPGHQSITPASTVYSFGVLLVGLLSGKLIQPNQFLQISQSRQNWSLLLDSALVNSGDADRALELIPITASCLQKQPRDRPAMPAVLKGLQEILNGNQEETTAPPVVPELSMSLLGSQAGPPPPFATAVEEEDYERMHYILVNQGYGTPPDGGAEEPSFEFWDEKKMKMLTARKEGDKCFQARKWEECIQFYNEHQKLGIPLPFLFFARRSFAYLMHENYDSALINAVQVKSTKPEWPGGYFLQAIALKKRKQFSQAAEEIARGISKHYEYAVSKGSSTTPSPK